MDLITEYLLLIPPNLLNTGIVLACIGLFWLIKRQLVQRIRLIGNAQQHRYAGIIAKAIDLPLNLLIVAVALLVLDSLLEPELLGERYAKLLDASIFILFSSAVILFIDRFLLGVLHRHAKKSPGFRNSTGIIKGILRGLVIGTGLLIVLSNPGVSITPLIASLGITSLAVALALQPTLENFFSGVQLVLDKPIRVGDYIELESGEQGYVEKIGWRSTWIRMLPNNTVIMPNSVLSQSKIINYYYPSRELSVPVELGVHYNSDLSHVEQVCLEVAKEILCKHAGGVESYDTFVLFHTFDDSSINLTVMLRAHEYVDRFFLKSDFIKRIHERFSAEGIVIPFPIRAINTEQENAVLQTTK